MQASEKHTIADGSRRLYYKPVQNQGSYCRRPLQNLNYEPCSSVGNHRLKFSADTFLQLCTLESSSGTGGYPVHGSPSTDCFSPNEIIVSQTNSQSCLSGTHDIADNACGSPTSKSYAAQKLKELETVMLGPEIDNLDIGDIEMPPEPNKFSSELEKWNLLLDLMPMKDLRQGLCTCAQAIDNTNMIIVE